MDDLFSRRNVHRGWKRVVRRLAPVDVIVRMDRLFGAHLAAGHLDRAVGYDFVRVHVRLRAAAGLPDEEGEVLVKLAVDHLIRGSDDELDLVGRDRLQLTIDERGGFLQHTQRADHRPREMLGADMEVVEGALRLRAPVPVGSDGDGAHGVGFGACTHVVSALEGTEESSHGEHGKTEATTLCLNTSDSTEHGNPEAFPSVPPVTSV